MGQDHLQDFSENLKNIHQAHKTEAWSIINILVLVVCVNYYLLFNVFGVSFIKL